MKLMTHIVVGYPDLKTSEELILTLDKYSKYIELQIPFSDPIADGPVIMKASQESLDRKTRVHDAFDLASRVSSKVNAKLLFMTYGNIVLNYGIEAFILDSKKAGIKGFIIPDISPDNMPEFFEICKREGLLAISIFAPTSSLNRMKKLAKYSPDIIYAVARTGVTGANTDFGEEIEQFLSNIRSFYDGEIALGFGVKSKQDIAFLEGKADIAVIGSQIIRELEDGGIKAVDKFLSKIMK